MTLIRFFVLAGGLGLSGGRGSRTRIALTACGIGFGVALLLGALAFGNAVRERHAREVLRLGSPVAAVNEHQGSDTTLMWRQTTGFEGHDIEIVALRGGPNTTVPTGIPRLPKKGEVFVSDGMRALLEQPSGYLLAPRFGGSVVGTVQPQGLIKPSENLAYVSAGKGLRPSEGTVYGGSAQEALAEDPTYTLVILSVALLAFLFPVSLFVVTATRLSTATREARLAAIRLAGGTNRQVRAIIAIEAALVAIIGVAVGSALFVVGRALTVRVPNVASGWLTSDLWPQLGPAVAVLTIVPALVLIVALVGSARIVFSPLGLIRPTRRKVNGLRWIWVGSTGWVILSIAAVRHTWVMDRPSPFPGILIAGSGFLILIGLIGGAGWLSWLWAGWLASRTRSTSLLLGARRLQADPGSANRVVAGVAVLVTLVGLGQAVALQDARDRSESAYVAPWVRDLPPNTVIAEAYDVGGTKLLRSLGAVNGVQSIQLSRQSPTGGRGDTPRSAILTTDGNPATVERVRNQVIWHGDAFSAAHWQEASVNAGASERTVARVMRAIALLVLLVTAASLLISTVDGLLERRRSHAMLSAIGATRRTLRQSILVQVAVPLAVAVSLGVGCSIFLTVLIFQFLEARLLLPLTSLALLSVAAATAALAVTGMATFWDGRVRSAEQLHLE